MGKRFHLNTETGVISLCHAKKGNCPYGGDSGMDNHYDSIDEAHEDYQKKMKDNMFNSLKATKNNDTGAIVEKMVLTNPIIEEKKKRLNDLIDEMHSLSGEKAEDKKKFFVSEKHYQMNLERKKLMYEVLAAEKDQFNSLSDKDKKRYEAQIKDAEDQKMARSAEYIAKAKVKGVEAYHPAFKKNSKTFENALTTISSFSGKSVAELNKMVNERVENGEDLTTATRNVWSDVSLRTDKKLVAIDLECAAPYIDNQVDRGKYSSIIEVGYIIRNPDGTIEKKSYLCGIDKNLEKACGTGAEHIHHISPEMIKDFKPFDDDKDRQNELLNDLKGSVLIAHNANYENTQFDYNLPGYTIAKDNGEIEILDTMNVSKFFCTDAENNTNEKFVEATGGEYHNAHRAFEDAQMSLNALLRFKNISEV